MVEQKKILRVFRLIHMLSVSGGYTKQALSTKLDLSIRSISRYFILLEELGYEVVEQAGVFSLKTSQTLQDLSIDQTEWRKIYDVLGKSSNVDGLMKKVAVQGGIDPYSLSSHDLIPRRRKLRALSEALDKCCRVVLCDYHSINSETVRHRVVEPIAISELGEYFWAVDITDPRRAKRFKIGRMSEVEILPSAPQEYAGSVALPKIDAFEFSGSRAIVIDFQLSAHVAQLLLEQHQKIKKDLTEKKDGKYTLHTEVYHTRAILRFVLSHLDGVFLPKHSVLREPVLLYLDQQIQKMKSSQYRDYGKR